MKISKSTIKSTKNNPVSKMISNIFNDSGFFDDEIDNVVSTEIPASKKAKAKKAEPDTRSQKEIIEEIHNAFYTEVDNLLAEAKILNSLESDKMHLIEKTQRLAALGFTNTKEFKDCQSEMIRLDTLKKENAAKEHLTAAINHYSFKYPQYKFITEESVLKLCKKYGLIFGTNDRYVGEIPYKNLKDIEDFKIDENEEATHYILNRHINVSKYANRKQFENWQKSDESKIGYETKTLSKFEIVAPEKDFNMAGMHVVNYQIEEKPIEVPDPIVLKPVLFQFRRHFLVVTAWGLEASDELVVNEKLN